MSPVRGTIRLFYCLNSPKGRFFPSRRKVLLAGLNALQGESLCFDPDVSLLPPKASRRSCLGVWAGSVGGRTEGQDEA